MRVGVITSIPWLPGTAQERCFQEALDEVELAEALGFDSVWVTEHHFALHGLCSGISTFLAAVATRTRRVRFGPAVFVLPFWNPIRLAEDAAVLDILSGGRLEFAVGTGYRLEEFRGFNLSPEASRAMGRECLDLVLRLWTGDPVTFQGQFYQVNDVAVYPSPLQKPHPPVWYAANSPETLEFVAQRGYNWLTAATFGTFPQLVERRRAFDQALQRYGRSPEQVRVYVHAPVYVAPAGYEEIRRETEEGVLWFRQVARWFTAGRGGTGGTIYDRQGTGGAIAGDAFDYADFYDNNTFFGDPETCFQKIERFCREMRPTDLVLLFKMGQPHAKVVQMMELFAREVLPRVRALPPAGEPR